MSLSTVALTALIPTSIATAIPETRSINADEWEKERSALYQQLDEKVIIPVLRMTNISID